MEGVISIVLIIYSLLLTYYHRSLRKLFKSHKNELFGDVTIDVVVAYRNESANLPHLLTDLGNLNTAGIVLKVYLVNDHSTDTGAAIVEEFRAQGNIDIHPFHLHNEIGKKAAISAVLDELSSEWILFTDADCRLDKGWLQSYRAQIDNEVQCILGAVRLTDGNSLFGRFQQLEFMSLQAATAASCLAQNPIMCNGANWMVRRSSYLALRENIKKEIASGDDMFILQALKRQNARQIRYNIGLSSLVETKVVNSFGVFWAQRNRWTTKSKYYTDPTTIAISLLVVFANIAFVLSFWYVSNEIGLLWFILAKLASEYLVLQRYAKFSGEKLLLKEFPLLALCYPFYIILIVGSSIFAKFQWKDRSYQA